MPAVQHKRGTRANLEMLKTNSELVVGQLYIITDENRIAVATAVNAYTDYALKSETDAKVTANVAITGATKTKITYDAKGLVTAGADATTADIADSLNKRYVTDAYLTILGNTSGTNTGDETQSTIKTKLGAATTSVDGYLTSTNWNTFNNKQAAITGGATTITSSNLTANRALISDASGKVAVSSTVSDTELGYLDGVTSAIQTQINGKQASLGFTAENSANKENATIDTSTTKYPTVNLLKTGLDGKVTTNTAITGATKTKITYDAKGLVTAGADATTADIADSLNKRYVTDAYLTILGNTSGTNTGDETQSTIKTKLGAATTSVDGYLTATDWNTFNNKQASLGFTAENSANKENTTIDTSTTKYPTINLLKTGLDGKVTANTAITGATKAKITYDAKGLVTAGADLANTDMPASIDATKIANGSVSNTEFQYLDGVTSAIQTQLNAKLQTIFYSQSNLTIDGANGNYFLVSLSANTSFSLSNIATGVQYYFRIKNTSGSAITITLPNTADIKSVLAFGVGASNKYKEVAMIYDGTNRTWEIGEELT